VRESLPLVRIAHVNDAGLPARLPACAARLASARPP
jgi:hypothetical protein